MKTQINVAFANFEIFKKTCLEQSVTYTIVEERSDSLRVEIVNESPALMYYLGVSVGLNIGASIAIKQLTN